MTIKYYFLDGREIKSTDDVKVWAKNFGSNRHVGRDYIGPYMVSTVFLGIDHGWPRDGDKPILFETMIFKDGESGDDKWTERCATYNEAEAMHMRGIEWAMDRNSEKP